MIFTNNHSFWSSDELTEWLQGKSRRARSPLSHDLIAICHELLRITLEEIRARQKAEDDVDLQTKRAGMLERELNEMKAKQYD